MEQNNQNGNPQNPQSIPDEVNKAPEGENPATPTPAVGDAAEAEKKADEAQVKEEAKQAPHEEKQNTAVPAAQAAKGDEGAADDKPADEKKVSDGKKKKSEKPRRPRRKHYVLRVIGALFRFILTLLLGMAIAYGSIFGAVYYAISGLTIDDLQGFGIATNADQYLTQNGEVDLTALSLLELIADFNSVRAELGNHTLQTLINRYGIALPEATMQMLPTDLFSVPLNTLLSSEGGAAVAKNLKFGYILSFLPEGMLSQRVIDTLSERPLALLTSGKYGELLAGVKLGYLTGVAFDEAGNVLPNDPANLTMQEATADLDLGKVLTATTQNGDLLGVVANDLGDRELRPILSGMMQGALLEKMATGRYVKDAIVLDPNTGRYGFSLPSLAQGLYLGDALNYIKVGDAWYTAYTDDGDDTNDTRASAMNATLADIPLADVINGTFSVEGSFEGLYFGDLQNGYVRGEAITEPDPEGGEPIVTGYHWFKDGAELGKMQSALANIAVSTVISGGLDINAILGSLYLGDLQGYTYREILDTDGVTVIGHKWVKVNAEDNTEAEVGAILAAVADISLSDVLGGNLDIVAALGGLKLGNVQGYTYREILDTDGVTVIGHKWVKVNAEDNTEAEVSAMLSAVADISLSDVLGGNLDIVAALGGVTLGSVQGYTLGADDRWYREVTGTGEPTLQYVGAVQNSLAAISLSDVLGGNFSIATALEGVRMGDAMNYDRGSVYEAADPTDDTSYDKYEFFKPGEPPVAVTGTMLEIVNLPLTDVLEGRADFEDTVKSMTLAEVLEYTKGEDGVWYSAYVGEGHADNVPVKGILAVLADKRINELNASTVDGILIGNVLGYTYRDDAWYDEANNEKSGIMAVLSALTVGNLSNDDLVLEKLREITLAEAMGYVRVGGIWYSQYSDDGDSANDVKLNGILRLLADKKLNEINSTTIDGILIGDVLGYTKTAGVWYGEANVEVKGMMAMIANLSISDLSSEDALATKLRGLTLAEAMGYEQRADGWYAGEQRLSGILQALATKPLNSIDSAASSIKLGEALGFTYNTTEGKWYNGAEPATGLLVSFADLTISEMQDPDKVTETLNQMKLADVLGYTSNGTSWIKGDHVASGVMAHLMGITIANIEHEIEEMPLGYAFGFYYDEANQKWYTDEAHTKEPTGITAALADIHLTHVREDFEHMKIGTLFGYTYKEGDGWYNGNTKLKDGLSLVFADMLISDLNDTHQIASAMQSATLGDSLGYMKHTDGKWYHTKTVGEEVVIDTASPVIGLIAALADSKIGDIESSVQSVKIGTMLDFTYHEGEGKWYNGTEAVTGVLAVISNANMNNLSQTLDTLQLQHVMPNPTGLLKAIDPATPINGIDEAVSRCKFSEVLKPGVLTAEGVTLGTFQKSLLDQTFGVDGWQDESLVEVLTALLTTTPSIP